MLRTYQPKKRQRKKEHGFRKRMRTADGRNVAKEERDSHTNWSFHSYSLRCLFNPCEVFQTSEIFYGNLQNTKRYYTHNFGRILKGSKTS